MTSSYANPPPFRLYVKKPEAPLGREGMNGHPALKPHSFEVNMAFSIEEAPCGSTGFFTAS